MSRALSLSLLLVGVVGCSGSSGPLNPEFPDPKAKAAASAEAKAEAPLPPGTVARNSVDDVLLRGPGWLLGRVQTDEVLRQNKFIGWRLVSFPADWDRTGLQPGDVVTELNGVNLEKPEDLWNAWLAMTDAAEIRIAFERDGKPAQTVVKIHGEPVADTRTALESGVAIAPPPSAAEPAPAKRTYGRKTVVITDESVRPSDDDTSAIYY